MTIYEDLRDKNVLITGANGGLGRQLVTEFSANGANVIVHARTFSPDFKEWIEDIEDKTRVTVKQLAFDLTDVDGMRTAFKNLPPDLGIDILVNNAGIAHGGLAAMTPVAEVRRVFEINYFSQIEVTQLVLRRMMRKRSGNIINVASISGLDAKAGNVAYGASKAAMIAFTRTLSTELSGFGIRVNCVAPGLIDTNMAKLMEKKALASMIEDSGMKRLATAEEVARTILFLSSSNSSFVNGQTLRVDGGSA